MTSQTKQKGRSSASLKVHRPVEVLGVWEEEGNDSTHGGGESCLSGQRHW